LTNFEIFVPINLKSHQISEQILIDFRFEICAT